MKELIKAYRFLNLISIDVAFGAVVCAAFFSSIFSVQLRVYGLAALGLSVWIIYTLDHLMDAWRLKDAASTKRHQFHQEHLKLMAILVSIACLIDVYLILHIRKPVFSWGLGLATLVVFYLMLQRWLNPFKEIVASVLYCSGVLLPTLSLATGLITTSLIILLIIFLITALINLILFSMFDVEKDIKQTQSSLVIAFGKEKSRFIIIVLFLIQVVLLISLSLTTNYNPEVLILGLMNFVLGTIFIFSKYLKKGDSYRLLGDVIFLFPVPYLIMNG
jgi:hypothetical protein